MLENGAPFPPVAGRDSEGNDVDLAQLVDGSWGAVLLYRGHW